MKEEEAKTKWCPHTRAGNDAGCNRNDATTNCIASDCMMWVEDPAPTIGGLGELLDENLNYGHCGLTR